VEFVVIGRLTTSLLALLWPATLFAYVAAPGTWIEAKSSLDQQSRVFLRDKRVDQKAMQDRVYAFENRWAPTLTQDQLEKFQRLVGTMGLKVAGELVQAKPSRSFWQLELSYLDSYRWNDAIPYEVDYWGVGAGLAGAGAMPVMLEFCQRTGCTLGWGDAQGVGRGASSLNGGNFAEWSERFNGLTADMKPIEGRTEGLDLERYKFYKFTHADWSEEQTRWMGHQSALLQMRNGVKNARLLQKSALEKGIDADISSAGWFRPADDAEDELHVREEMELAQSMEVETEWWDASRIERELGMKARFGGRLVKGFGNYHPYKYVTGVFDWGVKNGLDLYTNVKVLSIDSSRKDGGPILVHTNKGTIRVRKKVLLFTDAYTDFIPHLKGIIQPFQSRVLNFEHVENRFQGFSITRFAGDWYMNGPKSTWYVDPAGVQRMMMLLGGGPDTPVLDPWKLDIDPDHYAIILRQAYEIFPQLRGQPPSRVFNGPFAFTPDGMAIVGEIDGPDVVGSLGSQGYGGTQSGILAWALAKWITESPSEAERIRREIFPQEFFGLDRFKTMNGPAYCSGLVLPSPPKIQL
jgi:glycine/D-amino acid oxidase-like deaminating enzyme